MHVRLVRAYVHDSFISCQDLMHCTAMMVNKMQPLVEFVRTSIDPKVYYEAVFGVELQWPSSGSEARVKCCFHEEKTPSLSLNPENGKWYCHGCKEGGKSIISFAARLHKTTIKEACEKLFHDHVHPTVDDRKVRIWVRKRRSTPTVLRFLLGPKRMLTEEIADKYQIGWNGWRITLPIRNEFGLCVNVKQYDPRSDRPHDSPKMINYTDSTKQEKRSFGSPPMLYPLSSMKLATQVGYVVVCEGEWDALYLISLGIPAVTTTAGSRSWPKQYNELFRGLNVIIAYDNDHDGNLYARKSVLRNLRRVAKQIRRLDIPRICMPNGKKSKDVTEWAFVDTKMRSPKAWRRVFDQSRVLLENPDEVIERSKIEDIPLDQASLAKWHGRRVRVKALIRGKDIAPYILPKSYRVSCSKECESCPLKELDKEHREQVINTSDGKVLSMIDVPEKQLHSSLITQCGIGGTPQCKAQLDVMESFNVEQLMLTPTIESHSGQYAMRPAYFVGHGLYPNRSYQFEGTTLSDPKDMHATHLFDLAKPTQDEIETFAMSTEIRDRLRKFQVPDDTNIMRHLMTIADWQSRNVTRIKKRPDLHIAVDLVFHSANSFDFNGEFIKRGMLDVLILGDTRAGKGYVTEGLSRYYGLGEVASGELCSFAGLVGGLQQIGKRWIVTWGVIPLNNDRLVVIDEVSSLSEQEIGHMSRVRSEGVAEISKIVREATRANTRLVWLSNPRFGHALASEDYGVKAIKKLIGANEDIARFDFALTVALEEVDAVTINEPNPTSTDGDKFPREDCRNLVLWAWSRTPNQIQFSPEAVQEVLHESINLGEEYSPAIPLVQGENIRIKLAKLSAAIGARVFSTDQLGENLCVEIDHVKTAAKFLRMVYNKPSMAYDAFSKAQVANTTIEDFDPVNSLFNQLGKDKDTIASGLMNIHRVTMESVADYVGDMQVARSFVSELVKMRCLQRMDNQGGNWYLKNASFTKWLREQKKGGSNGSPVRQSRNGKTDH